MNKISANKVGLAVGGLFAVIHAVWALMVSGGIAKPFMDWILSLHFMSFQYSMTPFSLGTAVMLVIVTAVLGYIMGFVLGWLWNVVHRQAHGM